MQIDSRFEAEITKYHLIKKYLKAVAVCLFLGGLVLVLLNAIGFLDYPSARLGMLTLLSFGSCVIGYEWWLGRKINQLLQ